MSKMTKLISVVTLSLMISFSATAPMAHADYYEGHHHGGGGYHHGGGGDYGDGFFAGIMAAFITTYLILISDYSSNYYAETLTQSAALYKADGTVTPVFEAFASDMAEQMTTKLGDQMKQLDDSTLNTMIADKILEDAALEDSK